MEDTVDLFEDYENLPQAVQDIIESKDEYKNSYEENHRMIKELEPLGYIFDFGLCGEPIDLQKISQCEIGEWATFEDWIVKDEGVLSNYGMVMSFSNEAIPNCVETNWYAHLTLKSGESVTVNAHEIKKLY